MLRKKIFHLAVIMNLVVAMSLVSSPNLQADDDAALPQIGTLQVGYMPILAHASFFIAQEKGYFSDQGLEVELHRFQAGPLMIAPLSAGRLDVGAGGIVPTLLNAMFQQFDVRSVMVSTSLPPTSHANPLLVRKALIDSGEVTRIADLKGRKIGVNILKALTEYQIAYILAQADLSIEDVELVVLSFPDMPAALANGAIDAAALPYPLAGRPLADGTAVDLIFLNAILPDDPLSSIYFGQRLLDPANREVGVRFLTALFKAMRDVHGEHWYDDDHIAIYQKYINLPTAVIKNSPTPNFNVHGKHFQEGVMRQQEYYVGRGYTEFDTPLPFEQLFNLDFLDAALERVGEF